MKIVLISTYELGRQPFGLASPAAWLRKRGHRVVALDLARQSRDQAAIGDAALIAIYLPMHTATRLAAQLIPQLRKQNPSAHLCCYGLYAPMNVDYLRALGVSTILGGEFEEELAHLAERLETNGEPVFEQPSETLISMARLQFEVPDRTGMPAMEKYAHLIVPGDGYRMVPQKPVAAASTFAGIAPSCPSTKESFESLAAMSCSKMFAGKWPPERNTLPLAIRIFLMAFVTRWKSWRSFTGNFRT
jgi:hypothetical protein